MPETHQQKPLNELLSRSMVDIYVGPNNTHWVLHEKLLCYHSPFFRKIFYNKTSPSKSFGLPEDEDLPFKTFVGWLYSSSLPVPREEGDLSPLFDLYLMAEKWQIPLLAQDTLQTVREWYKYSDTYPGLRRVQYIYANTEDGSPMRHMMMHAIARQMALEQSGIPKHWDKALRKNGQLAVDIIRAIQEWRLDEEMVPDAREEPADAEELVDVEGEVGDEEFQGDPDEETVVESPMEGKGSPKQEPAQVPQKQKNEEKMVNGMDKLAVRELPVGVGMGDYGTNH